MAAGLAMPLPVTIEVRHESGVGEARRAAKATAAALGFSPTAAEEVALATTELATNLIRHAAGGTFESLLVGVIDGLGHGLAACSAARAAQVYVESHLDLPLDEIFCGAGRACRATRGVVMALARFDWGRGRMAFASVGNIEVRVFPPSELFRFSIRRGVVGFNAPRALVTEHPWPPGHVFVLHSDGLTDHWEWEDFQGLTELAAPAMAQELLRSLAKEDDDATVVVVKEVSP